MAGSNKADYVWMDGKVVPWDDAKIHVSSEAVLRGASIFEGMRAYWNEKEEELFIFKNEEHLQRLRKSAKILRLTMPYSDEELTKGFVDLLRTLKYKSGVHFRPVVYFDEGEPYSWRPEDITSRVFVLAFSRPHAATVSDRRQELHLDLAAQFGQCQPLALKASANYHNSRFANIEAKLNGFGTPIMLNDRGEIAESPGSCFMMVRDGVVITPPVTADILESITRTTLIKLFGAELGTSVIEREIDRTEAYIADEAFFCGSGQEVQPIVSVDHYPVGDGKVGPLTRKIQSLYFDIAKGNVAKYREWLTPVYGKRGR